MFKNYLKTALRFFANNKGFSLLNIAGLSIGTMCCIYMLLYVRGQYSYDRYFSDAGRIYRVTSSLPAGHATWRPQATTPPSLALALEKEFPHLLTSTRVIPTVGSEEHFLSAGPGTTSTEDAYMVDSNFFQLFDFHFAAGRADSALALPHSIVLLKTVAATLFGKEDPQGREVWVQNGYGNNRFVVGGIIDESRGRSSIHADLFIRINPDAYGNGVLQDSHWSGRYFAYTFIKMNPAWSGKDIDKRLTGGLHLQPISRMHTTDGYDSEMGRTVSGVFLAILIGLAALIQLIACINFMNLATARASRRAKEVGVRKVVGADSKGLIIQFLLESFLLSLAAVLIVLPLLIVIFPWLNKATGADIPQTVFAEPAVGCLLVAIAVFTGMLAGSYPAFYLSAFQTTKVIKGDLGSPIAGAGLRRSLVIFQFALSIVLIVCMLVIRRQLDFIRNKDLGFYRDGQIVFSFGTYGARRTANYFATAIRELPEVRDACLTDNYPGALSYQSTRIYLKDTDPAMAARINTVSSDEHFLKTMGIPLVSGRDLTYNDTGSVIINQSMAQRLGLEPGNAPGRRLLGWDGGRYTIAGVMKDFNYQSLHETVSPFMVVYRPTGAAGFDHLIVSAASTQYSTLLSKMDVIWKQRVFVGPFSPVFLTDKIQLLYKTEIILSRIIESFSVMAILISCLGLFGLAAFNAEQRTREIGIRKVMGASVAGIVRLLTRDFLKLISISFLVAAPISWWVMNKWLGVFIYHIDIPWWTFGVAGGATILIGMTVVCLQVRRAAVVNPVESLRAV
jgi:putative ABC transport system permease protein